MRELLLAGRRRTREVWLADDLDRAAILDDIVELARELRVPVQRVRRGRVESAARTDAPQGVIAFAAPLPEVDLDELAAAPGAGGAPPFLLLLDGITDPGNLGAILRSAEGAGVSGVVLPRHGAALVTATVTKAAAGAVEHLPLAVVPGLASAIPRLQARGLWVVGLDAAADRTLYEIEWVDGPVALVLGAEGEGLGRLVRQRCDAVAAIPLRGRLTSLNVGMAAAVACFEVARRRA
ncbi:MAG: 23S rRNA (guanosine(2251)-2'-O)-methyltransferase RlmB [Acidimicrobiales bacterium]|nr:23S rRNA (guanosine(2251)-2'-O)-methyltransferase RlmB [Acidimicrobiales bacterium]